MKGQISIDWLCALLIILAACAFLANSAQNAQSLSFSQSSLAHERLSLIRASIIVQSSQFLHASNFPPQGTALPTLIADGNCIALRHGGACVFMPKTINNEQQGVKYEDSQLAPM